jgi:DNA polymerase-4
MQALCRDCDRALAAPAGSCPHCGGHRIVAHEQLFELAIAHVDCDAFYASVEKAHRPELRDRPVIVGGGTRGVVAACCYIARLSGVRSAMPMFKALKLCPDAEVIRPDMARYAEAARAVRALMAPLTPLVQPLSIDEAVLDLSGTQALHNAPPAAVLSRFARAVERDIGIPISVGLAPNRLLAKLAAERDKPRGFYVFGAEAAAILAPEPVGLLPGIGPAMQRTLAARGITRLGQLAGLSSREAMRLCGPDGPHLAARARGEDSRPVDPRRITKSISAETTFATDLHDLAKLEAHLWPLCEKLGRRLRAEGFAAADLTLKLKTSDFSSFTRAIKLANPTMLPDLIFNAAQPVLKREIGAASFRLIGIGASHLVSDRLADQGDLADTQTPRLVARQTAIDDLRARFGPGAIGKGRALCPAKPPVS